MYITDAYQIQTPIAGVVTMKGNIIVNLENTDIFKKTVGNKLDCFVQFSKLGSGSDTFVLKSLNLVNLKYFEAQKNYLHFKNNNISS